MIAVRNHRTCGRFLHRQTDCRLLPRISPRPYIVLSRVGVFLDRLELQRANCRLQREGLAGRGAGDLLALWKRMASTDRRLAEDISFVTARFEVGTMMFVYLYNIYSTSRVLSLFFLPGVTRGVGLNLWTHVHEQPWLTIISYLVYPFT